LLHKLFSHTFNTPRLRGLAALLALLFLGVGGGQAAAQEPVEGRMQVLRGSLPRPGVPAVYVLEGLEAGQTLTVFAEGTSGNLDPFVALAPLEGFAQGSILGRLAEMVADAQARGEDPLALLGSFADENLAAWDDDSGGGFAAAFAFEVPADGDYVLGIISAPFDETFGDYRMVLGLDAPEPATGEARAQGQPFARPLPGFEGDRTAVQETAAALSAEVPARIHRLLPFRKGERLDVFVQATSGDLIPEVMLTAYGMKPIRSANIGRAAQEASFSYTFPLDERGYELRIAAAEGTSGEYRLVVGRDAPEIVNGDATMQGEAILQAPIQVQVGTKLQQIAGIDQKSERYEAVVSLLMRWNDPALAFRPDECGCEFKTYSMAEFTALAEARGIMWPEYTYLNQQNNRWVQNDNVVVYPNGDALLFERFTTTFQAPDFDFRQFPFDKQTFFIRVDSLLGTRFFEFVASDDSEVGTQLGEEEWYITDSQTEIVTELSSTGSETSGFVFRFFAQRHLSFYILRIFVPLLLILSVTWITFFMDDYSKRVDATTANLLLFIAFNFTVADDLPRLGYLTLMDTILVGTFFISVLTVIYNVYLRRQEKRGHDTVIQRIDKYMIWLYPLGYLIIFLAIGAYYFWL
jgi:hypothetical protein